MGGKDEGRWEQGRGEMRKDRKKQGWKTRGRRKGDEEGREGGLQSQITGSIRPGVLRTDWP